MFNVGETVLFNGKYCEVISITKGVYKLKHYYYEWIFEATDDQLKLPYFRTDPKFNYNT